MLVMHEAVRSVNERLAAALIYSNLSISPDYSVHGVVPCLKHVLEQGEGRQFAKQMLQKQNREPLCVHTHFFS